MLLRLDHLMVNFIMNKYNEIEFDPEIWEFFGIDDDIRNAWDNRFGEENVSLCLVSLRDYLKKRPDYQGKIDKYCGGNWAIFIWNALERDEDWRKEREAKGE